MNPVKQKELADGVVFNSISDNRFKTMKLLTNIFIPMSEQTASVYALLCYVMVRCCKKYPDMIKMSRKLGSLYGAEVNGSVSKMGDMQCLKIDIGGLSDKYAIDNENISAELSELLCEVLFNPKVENGKFDEKDSESIANMNNVVRVRSYPKNDKGSFLSVSARVILRTPLSL